MHCHTMVLLCMIIYVCAILLTSQVKGNQFYEGTEQEQATNTVDPDRKKVHEYFESVSASMLTLFQVVTLENWPDIARMHCKSIVLVVLSNGDHA